MKLNRVEKALMNNPLRELVFGDFVVGVGRRTSGSGGRPPGG